LAGLVGAMIAMRAGQLLRVAPRQGGGRADRPDHISQRGYADLLEAIARQVRSGSSLTAAFVDEATSSSMLDAVLGRISAGASLPDALKADVPDNSDLAYTVQALAATARLGGPIAATLDEAAAVLRERGAARAERRAHGSQARLSARVLTVVPLAFGAWSAMVSQQTRAVYLSSAAGATCALCGLSLNLVGWRWMRRILGPACQRPMGQGQL
jgi:Flp pilus assembly protein TadB